MEDQGISSSTFVFVLVFFIVNVFINLYLMNKYFNERRKYHQQKAKLKKDPDVLKEFFSVQARRFKSAQSVVEDSEASRAYALRAAYLKVEYHAVDKGIDSTVYDQYILDGLRKIIALLSSNDDVNKANLKSKINEFESRINKLPFDDSKAEIKQKALRTLQSYSNALETSKCSAKEMNNRLKKISGLIEVFESPHKRRQFLARKLKQKYVKNSAPSVDTLSRMSGENDYNASLIRRTVAADGSQNELLDKISEFQSENEKLHKLIKKLKSNLKAIDKSVADDLIDSGDLESNSIDGSRADSYSDELIEANEQEVDRLRGVISAQRSSILQMEGLIDSLEKANVDAEDEKSDQIKKLKKCVQESEACITILEGELDSLRSSLAELMKSQSHEISDRDANQLNEELVKAVNNLKESDSKILQLQAKINFISELLSARSIEDISLLIYENVSNLNYIPNVILKAPNRNLVISNTGELSVSEKATINGMRINEFSISRSGQLNFRLKSLAGIIKPVDIEFSSNKEASEYLIELLRLANQCIELHIRSQSVGSGESFGDVAIQGLRSLAFNLDQILDEQSSRTKRLVLENISQIGDVARAKGVGASVIAKINQIEQETGKQLLSESSAKIKARRQLLSLIDELEALKRKGNNN